MTPLVEKLSKGQHPISLIRYKDLADFKSAIDHGLVLVKFTETLGGTEIGISLDQSAKDLDLTGEKVQLTGSLTLDYQPVVCNVEIELDSFSGYGCLKPVES